MRSGTSQATHVPVKREYSSKNGRKLFKRAINEEDSYQSHQLMKPKVLTSHSLNAMGEHK